MLKKGRLGNQKGFTLIEIIAVLLLLGILSAVALPKYIAMQEATENATLNVALNDMRSRAALAYASSQLANNGTAQAADQNSFIDDLGFADAAAVNDAYRDFAGTWVTAPTALTITYTKGFGGGTALFTLTAGDDADPATIALSFP